MKLTYISKFLLISFAFLVLLYNHSLSHDFISMPPFQQYHDPQQQKEAFYSYLRPLIEENNQDLLLMHQHIIDLRNNFSKNHQLTTDDLFWLITLYMKVKRFNPYQQQEWVDELNKVDIVPTSLILRHVKNIQQSTTRHQDLLQNKNPLGIYYVPDKCIFSRIIFNESRFGGADANCLYAAQLLYGMTIFSQNSRLAHYHDFQEAFTDYIWAVNTSPAYTKFRMIRANRRIQNQSIEEWNSPAAYDLLAPDRMLIRKNYEVETYVNPSN